MGQIKVLISYSWDNEKHEKWVENLAHRLEEIEEINVVFDQYDLDALVDINLFMERAATESDFTFCIVSDGYIQKADERKGGVGIETFLSSARHWCEVQANGGSSNIIPLLKEGNKLPRYLSGKYYIDFRKDEEFEESFEEIKKILRGTSKVKRPKKKYSLHDNSESPSFSNSEEINEREVFSVNTPSELENASHYYRTFIDEDKYGEGIGFDSFETLAQKIIDNEAIIIQIIGGKGSGKTTFMERLVSVLSQKEDVLPIFINIRKEYIDNNSAPEEEMKRCLEEKLHHILVNERESVHLIDGLDNDWPESKRYREYSNNALKFIKSTRLRKVVISSSTKDCRGLKSISRKLKGAALSQIYLKSLDCLSQKSQVDKMVASYCQLNGLDESKVDCFKGLISKYDMRYVDTSILKLVQDEIELPLKSENIAELVDKAISLKVERLNYSSTEEFLAMAEDYAYKATTGQFNNDVSENGFDAFIMIANNQVSRDYLVASYAIKRISQSRHIEDEELKQFNTVFDDRRNSIFRAILGGNNEFQSQVIDGIVNLYQRLQLLSKKSSGEIELRQIYRGMTHLCYLAGRIDKPEHTDTRERSQKFLEQCIEDIKSSLVNERPSGNREYLLLRRTVYISLAYLGCSEYLDEYMELLINDPVEDDLNRGFHLEYYSDSRFTALESMTHKDELGSCENTYNRIESKIFSILNGERKPHNLIDVEIHTLLSLAIHRHREGKLNDDLRNRTKKLVVSMLSATGPNIISNKSLKRYCKFVQHQMELPSYPVGRELDDLYALKNEERYGWVNMAVGRHGERLESVAEHTFGVYLIALLYLPECTLENGPDVYSKDNILKILFVHDLAEAFIGDRYEKSEEFKELESSWINYIGHLGVLNGVSSQKNIRDLLSSFEEKSNNLEIKIAKDFDILESLVQLYRYKNLIDNSVFKDFYERNRSRIETREVNIIAQKLLEYFSDKYSENKYSEKWPNDLTGIDV